MFVNERNLLLWCLVVRASVADNAENFFFTLPSTDSQGYPAGPYANNPVYNIGDSELIQWQTNLTQYIVSIVQKPLPGSAIQLYTPSSAQILFEPNDTIGYGQYEWIVTNRFLDLKESDVFYFEINGTDPSDPSFDSGYFNITEPISSSPQPTPSVTPTGLTESAADKASNHSGLVLGLSIGVPSAVIICALFCWCVWKPERSCFESRRRAVNELPAYEDLATVRSGAVQGVPPVEAYDLPPRYTTTSPTAREQHPVAVEDQREIDDGSASGPAPQGRGTLYPYR